MQEQRIAFDLVVKVGTIESAVVRISESLADRWGWDRDNDNFLTFLSISVEIESLFTFASSESLGWVSSNANLVGIWTSTSSNIVGITNDTTSENG